MAQRGAPKSGGKPARKGRSAAKPRAKRAARDIAAKPARAQHGVASGGEAAAADHDLERECIRLRGELEAAQARIKELEGRQDYVLNRIDWALDSLHSLLEEDEK